MKALCLGPLLFGCLAACATAPRLPTECWTPLGELPKDQELDTFAELSASGSEDGTLWVLSADPKYRIRRWDGERWTATDAPRFDDRHGQRGVLVASPKATVAAWMVFTGQLKGVAVTTNAEAGWATLGSPLRVSNEPYGGVEALALALRDDGRPLVACSEAPSLLSTLYVSEWTGTGWQQMGPALATGALVYSLDPTLALAPTGEPWVAWVEEGRGKVALQLRVWRNGAWQPLPSPVVRGREVKHPQLAFAPDGSAYLIWGEREQPREPDRFGLARWTGQAWEPLPAATAPSRRVGWPAILATKDGRLLAAWSRADDKEFSRVWVRSWNGSRWETVIDGLRLGVPPSDATDVHLARGAGADVFVVWDEPADNGERLRAIRLRTCAAQEAPMPLPVSPRRDAFWPKSVDEAVALLLRELSEDTKEEIRGNRPGKLIDYHFGLGLHIRNRFGLWQGNEALLRSCRPDGEIHPDDCSAIIIGTLLERLNGTP